MKPLAHAVPCFLFLICCSGAHASSLGDNPDPGDPCLADRQASFTDGYNAGKQAGKDEWYESRYRTGANDGASWQLSQCLAEPQSCGITLASCIPDPTFGETESNDFQAAADVLKLGQSFWGQSYGAADQDWFVVETTSANQNLIVNFQVPGGLLAGWKITVRDAAGAVFANFNTAVNGSIPINEGDEAVTYRVTLGLVGIYYIVVQPIPPASCTLIDPSDPACAQNFSPYAITAGLQDTSLDTEQPSLGFVRAEIEPNNAPLDSTPLATSVSMYGLVNLTFDSAVPSEEDTYVWGQGEDDWFYYYKSSTKSEILTLDFCAREKCGPGNWFVEVYGPYAGEQDLDSGQVPEDEPALLAFNTDNTNDPSALYRLGLKDAPGYYLMRVDHKRLFNAPCLNHQFVSTTSETGFTGFCECDDGANSCYIPNDCSDAANGLLCTNVVVDCVAGIEPGCLSIDDVPSGCGVPDAEGKVVACDTYQTQARCSCSQYGGVVQLPEKEYSSPYNFTWHITK